MFNLFDLFRKSKIGDHIAPDKGVFKQKYEAYKRVLTENNRALEIITDLERLFYEDKPFSLGYALVQTEILIGEVYNIAEDVNVLSEGKYPQISEVTREIGNGVLAELERKKKIEKTGLVIPLERLSQENASDVGGKAANLGEVFNRANLPVPQGFAITAYACQQFLDYSQLSETIDSKLRGLDINNTEELTSASEEIRNAVIAAPLPPDLEKSILQIAASLCYRFGSDIRLSVRSSATSEDSEASFAGQHATVLNVGPDNLIFAYKEVVASTFSPRAVFYRRKKGYLDQDVVMSVFCMIMINAKAAGVMYTVDPNDNRHRVCMVSAVWGLGVGAVDGSISTDFYQVGKQDREMEGYHVARKETQLVPDSEGGLTEVPLDENLRDKACLAEEQIQKLIEYGLILERHYGFALDIEWAMDQQDRLFILQARPLKRPMRGRGESISEPTADDLAGHPVLLQSGASACDGVASGRAYVLQSDHNLAGIPEGAILVAQQTSPRYVPVLGRVQGIVTDVGSVTGHMASVAREFHIPTLVGTGSATSAIPHGEEITIDARNRIIYKGRVKHLVKAVKPINPMKGSPTYYALANALKRIAPLNLIDPKDTNFKPEGCQTIHDIIRFAHEVSMQEMFRISDDIEVEKNIAFRLRVGLPLDIYVVDLENGLSLDSTRGRFITEENVSSVPLKSLLRGMMHKGIQWTGAIGMDWRGFASILAESVFRDPEMEGAMGGPSYAIVSKEYLNFNSRLGYHFATVDTYCGPAINDNYITFSFKGGAADIARRARRAQLIGCILKRLNFKVECKGDMVTGTLKKYDCELIQERLDMLGRLFGAVRLLDMVLSDDRQIEWYVEEFFKGNYTFRTQTTNDTNEHE